MKKAKIILKGPILTRSGYGEQARFALRALKSRLDLFEIYIQPIIWGQTSWIFNVNEERKWIDERIEDTIHYIQNGGVFDMSLQITIPLEFEPMAPINIGYTAGIETTKVAHPWLLKNNQTLNRLIVVSDHSKYVFENSVFDGQNTETGESITLKNEIPITTVNFPVRDHNELESLDLALPHAVNFVAVTQWGPRKNLDNTIKWFMEEFHDEEVGLVVKTNMIKNCLMDRNMTYGKLQHIKSHFPDAKCSLHLLHGDMSAEEIHALYKHPQIKALLSLTHGEGYGLPLFEAAYSGLPVIAPGWSGHLDFLIDPKTAQNVFYDVAFDLQPIPAEVVWENVLIADSMWCYPREKSAKHQMRQCYNDVTATDQDVVRRCAEHAKTLHETHAPEKMYKKFVDVVLGTDSAEIEMEEAEVMEFE